MADMDLSDDQVKLVRYKVLDLRRGGENVLFSGEELLWENMTADAYKVRVTAKFMRTAGGLAIPEADLSFLRVWFEVLDRYEREKLHYDEQNLIKLQGIVDQLATIGNRIAPPPANP